MYRNTTEACTFVLLSANLVELVFLFFKSHGATAVGRIHILNREARCALPLQCSLLCQRTWTTCSNDLLRQWPKGAGFCQLLPPVIPSRGSQVNSCLSSVLFSAQFHKHRTTTSKQLKKIIQICKTDQVRLTVSYRGLFALCKPDGCSFLERV